MLANVIWEACRSRERAMGAQLFTFGHPNFSCYHIHKYIEVHSLCNTSVWKDLIRENALRNTIKKNKFTGIKFHQFHNFGQNLWNFIPAK